MKLTLVTAPTDVGSKPVKHVTVGRVGDVAGNANYLEATIQKGPKDGWTVEVQGRMAAVTLAERIQDSDALLFVDEVKLRFGSGPSAIIVSGDWTYEPELLEIISSGGYY